MPGLEEIICFESCPSAYSLMSDGVAAEQVKKFFFTSRKTQETGPHDESLEIYIPEVITLFNIIDNYKLIIHLN